MTMRAPFCAFVSAFVICTTAAAQETAKALSFNPRPFSQARSFLITEFGLGHLSNSHSICGDNTAEDYGVTWWELGWMKNVNQRWAIGAAVFIVGDEKRVVIGIKPRAQLWLGRRSSVHAGLGPILAKRGDDHTDMSGLRGDIGYNANSWLGFTLGFEVANHEMGVHRSGSDALSVKEWTRTSYNFGVRISGVPGLIGGIAVPAFMALVFSAVFDDDESW